MEGLVYRQEGVQIEHFHLIRRCPEIKKDRTGIQIRQFDPFSVYVRKIDIYVTDLIGKFKPLAHLKGLVTAVSFLCERLDIARFGIDGLEGIGQAPEMEGIRRLAENLEPLIYVLVENRDGGQGMRVGKDIGNSLPVVLDVGTGYFPLDLTGFRRTVGLREFLAES